MSLDPLPKPPANPAGIRVTLVELGETLFRTHGIRRNPLTSGHAGFSRFDAPDGSYEVLYLGCDAFCAFVETFSHAAGTRAVTTAALKARALSELSPIHPLRLINLVETGALVRMGVDARLFSAAYSESQSWLKALHDHPAKADGLLYPSRLDPARQSVAVFRDRVKRMVEINRQSWYAPGAQRMLLAKIADHYGVELIENHFVVSRRPASSVRPGDLF